MTTFKIPVFDDQYFAFRRWLLARDPKARIRLRSTEDDELWQCRVRTSKRYLKATALRRFGS